MLGAFSTGIFSMYKPFGLRDQSGQKLTEHNNVMAEDDLKSLMGLFIAMFWLLFDPGQPDYVAIKKCGIEGFSCDNTDEKLQIGQVSLEFSHWIGYAMWACYQGITVILLINILMAMMNTTFSKIWQDADTAWKYSKSFYQVEFLDSRAIFPPPFRYKSKC